MAIITVLVLSSVLLVAAALVTDLGLVRVDRQVDKSAADNAVLAGLHGLNLGNAKSHPYAGVCQAVRYLRANSDRLSGITTGTGWTDGNGAPTASGCSTSTLQSKVCSPTDRSTWAAYSWSSTYQGQPVSVSVQSGYVLGERRADGSYVWPDDGLAASSGNTASAGCDQLAVIVRQSRQPGLGSLATTHALTTAMRSVGRVAPGGGGYAPAMILLKQTGCSSLTAGAAGGGSHIYVKGGISADGVNTQPGTIQADADGAGCASNEQVFKGQAQGGIVAFAAPLASAPTSADASKPGQISSYAALRGASTSTLVDSANNACGSAAVFVSSSTAPSGCPGAALVGRDRVYRQPVDERYLAAVTGMRDTANTVMSTASTASTATISSCTPTQTQIDALHLTASSQLYVNCTANNGFTAPVSIPAGTVVFAGKVAPTGLLSLPDATRVYVVGSSSDAISLTNGGTFSVHAHTNVSPSSCPGAATGSVDKAVVVVKNGDTKQTGGDLQLCNTTMLLEGGAANACLLPTDLSLSTAAPNPSTPCTVGGVAGTGTGQLVQTGGNVDWTAPNRDDTMLRTDGTPDPARTSEWSDSTGPEDLALWSESGGGSSNPKYQMTGGGTVRLVGVLMTPNAQPLSLSGSFNQTLSNAQYVASSVALSSNNTVITMSVDPNAAITVPRLRSQGLVR